MSKIARLFDAASRAKYARENPSTPTGVLFVWGGVTFDLLPLTYGELLEVTETVDHAKDVILSLMSKQDEIGVGTVGEGAASLVTDAIGIVANKAPALIMKVRDHLAKSPGVCDSGTPKENEEDRLRFDAWFLEQDAVAMLKAFFPKLKEVIGMRPLATPTPERPAAEPTSV